MQVLVRTAGPPPPYLMQERQNLIRYLVKVLEHLPMNIYEYCVLRQAGSPHPFQSLSPSTTQGTQVTLLPLPALLLLQCQQAEAVPNLLTALVIIGTSEVPFALHPWSFRIYTP